MSQGKEILITVLGLFGIAGCIIGFVALGFDLSQKASQKIIFWLMWIILGLIIVLLVTFSGWLLNL
jgi:hypothetical protein